MTDDQPRGAGMPSQIGRYRIVERVGRGAMGIVYSARDDLMDRDVAIKLMLADFDEEPETRGRFHREAQAAGTLSHPNIITVFDIGEDRGRCYIVMELLRGHTLQGFLKASEAPALERKLDMMIQLCEGLQAAHAAEICHRDIKPGNLFVREDGTLKILDFGVARLSSSSMTAPGFIVGTPDYMSPEQARGQEIDGRSDIFSAGAVFYFMLTGRKPFPGPDLPSVLHQVECIDPLPLRESEAPAQLAAIVMRALAKDRALRYQTCGELLAELSRFRRHDTEQTLQLARQARDQFRELESLVASTAPVENRLRLSLTSEVQAALRRVRHETPVICDDESDAVGLTRPERSKIEEIAAELRMHGQHLRQQRAAADQAIASFEEGSQALEAGDPLKALHAFERVVGAIPAFPDAADRLEAARERVKEQQSHLERVRALATEARTAAESGNWNLAGELSHELLRLEPANREYQELWARAADMIAQSARDRAKAAQERANRARRALKKLRLAEAERAVHELAELQPDHPELRILETDIAREKAATEARRLLVQRTADAVRMARQQFAAGRRWQAIAGLQAFVGSEPDCADARTELERLRLEDHRLAEIEHAVAAATAACDASNFQAAIDSASRALLLEPSHGVALQVLARARVKRREEQQAEARAAQVAACLATARKHLERGAHGKARRAARQALETDPASADAAGLMGEILRRETDGRLAREHDETRRQRAEAARPAIDGAREALAAGDCARACWAAENALMLAPESGEARALLEQARAAMSARPSGSSDDTVDIVRIDAAGTDDTVDCVPVAHRRPAPARGRWTFRLLRLRSARWRVSR